MRTKVKKVRSDRSEALARSVEEDLGSLIARCSEGDQGALAALYDRTAAQINGLAMRILGDREQAEEVTGDVFLQAWRVAASYDPSRGSPLAWLLTLARSRAIDRLRSGAAQRRQTNSLDETIPLVAPGDGPEEDAAAAQLCRVVKNALAQLGERQRRAIELAYFGGLSHGEIAREIGEPLGTVKTRVRLGMTRLRELLGGLAAEAS
jgi:RNA polymerase sigma-70 factor (ECF subfamily)